MIQPGVRCWDGEMFRCVFGTKEEKNIIILFIIYDAWHGVWIRGILFRALTWKK